jgi:hypothetical protein
MPWRVPLLIALTSALAMPTAHAIREDASLDAGWLDRARDFDQPAKSEARFRRELSTTPPGTAARLELSTQIARAQGLRRQFDAAHATLDAIACAYRSRDRYDEALSIQLRLAGEGTEAGAPDGYVYEELSELLLAKGDPATARPNFARALGFLGADAGLRANEPERLARLKRLGEVE